MYYRYFGLTKPPFSITPDPKFVYFSARHEEALAHLLYGIGQGGGGGFVQLTGEVGTGKTTLCRLLLEQLPAHVRPALILNPVLGPRELLATVCDELEVYYPVRATRKQLVDRLNAFLLVAHGRGETVVLIVDEAQNLSPQALEQIRLLTNLETATDKLLQIILVGQPELRALLDRPGLRQLAQRVTARYHLMPLTAAETERYVRHRLKVAGAPRCPFNDAALGALYRHSGGVPRLINVIADRALLAAYTREADRVDARSVAAAAREVLGGRPRRARAWLVPAGATASIVILALALVFFRGLPGAGLIRAQPATSTQAAWNALFDWWGVPLPEDARAGCAAAREAGLACLKAHAGWRALMPLKVPVLLFLDRQGDRALVLNAIDAGRASTLSGRVLERGQITPRWDGDYALLARLPEQVAGRLSAGDQGPAVQWLVARVRELDPAVQLSSGSYGEDLAAWVATFQQEAGLKPTGIADAATLITLAARSAPERR